MVLDTKCFLTLDDGCEIIRWLQSESELDVYAQLTSAQCTIAQKQLGNVTKMVVQPSRDKKKHANIMH